jgi:hypothetical protein
MKNDFFDGFFLFLRKRKISAGGRFRTCGGTKPYGVSGEVVNLKLTHLSPPEPYPFVPKPGSLELQNPWFCLTAPARPQNIAVVLKEEMVIYNVF